MTGAALAQAARALIGCPFLLHGRDPRTGLDCIGVLEAALTACGITTRLPNAYTLRTRCLPPLETLIGLLGLRDAEGPATVGDVLIVRPSPCQHHLAIATAPGSFVHAHAGLRRVVEGPLPRHWPVVRHLRPTTKRT
ncbi:NlpC/P60 family protein [Novosphingobium malaysiense]|uniref:NlpC/P60 domain-containing protein n=1 Tax=Novosphingobium malaysiense TaxID=1348853 RepID=A0A0B1ZP58_9SPHN|nr:hypothetical protein [Novosphingobium malaysiense]KHK92371.1 hypothetical protein LK12_06040 [Novosphingobium malaysiense]